MGLIPLYDTIESVVLAYALCQHQYRHFRRNITEALHQLEDLSPRSAPDQRPQIMDHLHSALDLGCTRQAARHVRAALTLLEQHRKRRSLRHCRELLSFAVEFAPPYTLKFLLYL